MKSMGKATGIVVSLFLLVLLILYADPVRLIQAASTADPILLMIAFILSTLNVFIRVLKWYVLIIDVPFLKLVPVQVLGLALSNLSPAKIAEPSKAVILKASMNIPVSKSLVSIVWERVLDIISIIILSIVALYFLPDSGTVLFISMAVMALFIIMTAIGILTLYSRRFAAWLFDILRVLPFARFFSDSFIETFTKVRIPYSKVSVSFILHIIAWLMEGLIMHFTFASLGVEINPVVFAGFFALATAIGFATTLPGGIGSTDAVMVIFVSSLGVSFPVATTGVIISRLITIWYLYVLGGLSFIKLTKKLQFNIKSIFS